MLRGIIFAGSAAWIIFTIASITFECEAKNVKPDHGLRYNITSTNDELTEEDNMEIPVVTGETVHRRTLPVSNMDLASDSVASDNTDVKAFVNADINTGEDYTNQMGRELSRDRRTLTFVPPSTVLLTFGLGTPLQLDSESVIVGAFAKIIYALPVNSTDFTEPGTYFSRTKSRWSIYKLLEKATELYGFGAGKGCLLRAICEVAATPFDFHHGLFGQMVQTFLSPSSTSEPYDEYTDREYHAAESLGKHVGKNCHALYPECERSVLDVFSTTAATLQQLATHRQRASADKTIYYQRP